LAPPLDKVLHQPLRTRFALLVAKGGEADFSGLKAALGVGDGQLSTHLREMIAADYLAFEKAFCGLKPRTTYRLTALGRDKLRCYVEELRALITPEP
jgi:DNA-binding HxlR family transcriptional regulator